MIKAKKTSTNSTEIWDTDDEDNYLAVTRTITKQGSEGWKVTKGRRSYKSQLGNPTLKICDSAQEAVEYAEKYLESGKDELDAALKDIS